MSGRRREDRLLDSLAMAVTPRPRRHLPVVIWRWRHEIAFGAGIALVASALARAAGIEGAIIGLSALLGVVSPPWPEWVTACAWRIITPHRLRAGLIQARIQGKRGRIPYATRVTREPFGERVLLWLPAGTSAEDLHSARTILRAACWAADVRVTRDREHAQLVTVDVIRRGVTP